MSSYLVTGGAGFIGSKLIEKLKDDGSKVTTIDNLSTGSYKIEWSLRHTFKDGESQKILSNCKKIGNYITYDK